MPTLLDRYLAGERAAVWRELGTDPLPPALWADARAVARETMRRVRRNVELLIERLLAEGYPFAHSLAPAGEGAEARYRAIFAPPLPGTTATLDAVERLVSPLPLSMRAWYEEVGAVNFQGSRFEVLGPYDDPLMVSPIEYTLLDAREWLDLSAEERQEYHFRWEFAPDVLHKANVSGGPPFGVRLPAPGADGVVEEETWGAIPFVAYLREAIRWGGFPGLRRLPPERQRRDLVARLTSGLLPF